MRRWRFSAAAVMALALGLAVLLLVFKKHVPHEPEPQGPGVPNVVPAVAPSRLQEAGEQPLVPPTGEKTATVGVETPERKRLLWQIATAGGPDRIVQMVVAGDRLLVAREGVIYALDPASGDELWRFPREGAVFGHTTSTSSSLAPPMIAALLRGEPGGPDDLLVTRLTREADRNTQGLLALRLTDGQEMKRHVEYPELENVYLSWSAPLCTRVVFRHMDYNRKQTVLSVFDLETWREVARFRLPGIGDNISVTGDWVVGRLVRRGAGFQRKFSANYKTGKLHSVRTKTPANRYVQSPFPRGASVFHAPDPDGARRRTVFLTTAGAAGNGASVAALDSHSAFVADAATGRMRLVIPLASDAGQVGNRTDCSLALDESRLFFHWSNGFAAYSIHPTDHAKPDPHDRSDPAWTLAKCRDAMRRGDWEEAIGVMMDIASQVQTVSDERRASARAEAASMLSLLERSPAADLWPTMRHTLKLRNGWIAGDLFVDDYVRAIKYRTKMGAGYIDHVLWGDLSEYLLMINSRRSLEILSRTVDNPEEMRVPPKVAALAAECLRAQTAETETPLPKEISPDPLQRLHLPRRAHSQFKWYAESNATVFDPEDLSGVGEVQKEPLQKAGPPREEEDQF